MKIYTKSGDNGTTGLVSGRRLSKSDVLIEAYGTVDELNAFVGGLLLSCTDDGIKKDLGFVQNLLFNIGSLLAKDGADYADYPTLVEADIKYLEDRIDHFNENLPKMTAFILPSGSASIVKAHICRTVCRRAERRVIIVEEVEYTEMIIRYLNRLSDYFFVLARYLHFMGDIREVHWDNQAREKL